MEIQGKKIIVLYFMHLREEIWREGQTYKIKIDLHLPRKSVHVVWNKYGTD